MARTVANVDITTETFGTWVIRTNTLLNSLSTEIITANSTYANTGDTGAPRHAQLFGTFTGNTLIASDALRGGNTSSVANLNITSNTIVSNVTFESAANSLYTNTQFFTANVQANGALLSVLGSSMNVTSNVTVTAANQQFKSNSTITAISIVGNTTATNTTIGGSALNVTSNVSITGINHAIQGNVNFDAATMFVDSVNNRVGILRTNPDAALSVNGAANVSSAVWVGGNTTVVGNAVISGTLHTVAGNVNFDAGTLFVDSVNNRVGLSNTTPDATLAVTGTANVSGASRFGSTVAVIGAATLSNTIAVTGAATLSNTLSVAGNVSLTSTGLHTIAGNVNFDANTMFVDSVNNRVGFGTATPDVTLTVNGAANVAGDVRLGSNLYLTGNATIAGNVHTIAGNASFDSGVLFVDAVNNRVGINNTAPDAVLAVTGTANVSGATRLGSTLTVVGATTLNSTLATGNTTVTGFVNATSSGQFGGTLAVTGAATIGNTLSVGNTTVTGSINISTTANVVGALGVNGAVTIANTLASGNTTITGFVNVSSSANVGGTLAVKGATAISNTLATGNTTITGFVNVSSSASVGGSLTVASDTVLSGTLATGNTTITGFVNATASAQFGSLTVAGTSALNGNVSVSGNATIAGVVTINTDYVVDVSSNTNIGTNAAARRIYRFAKANFTTGKLMVSASNGNTNQIAEMVLAHDGTDAYLSVYGVVASPFDVANTTAPLGTFSASINNANVEIFMTQTTSNSAVKVVAHLIK